MNHLHLGTSDLAKSVAFYQNLFGFRKKFDHDPGVFLENEHGFLLAIDPVHKVPELPSWFHLGFCLTSEAEVLETFERCRKHGARIARELLREENEFASFYVADPDGYKIEVSWHRTS